MKITKITKTTKITSDEYDALLDTRKNKSYNGIGKIL